MIKKDEVTQYISSIPPLPKVVKNCYNEILKGDLIKAATYAKEDPSLMYYLREITKKPIYGFSKELKDSKQIFGVLGIAKSKSIMESFMLSLLIPKFFTIFKLENQVFTNFQDKMLSYWITILEYMNIKNIQEYSPLAPLLCGTIVICDKLFSNSVSNVDLFRQNIRSDYNSILVELTGFNLFDIASLIAKKWELDDSSITIINILAKRETCDNEEFLNISRNLYMLFFYLLSKPEMIEAGVNDFLSLDETFMSDSIDEFYEKMGQYETGSQK